MGQHDLLDRPSLAGISGNSGNVFRDLPVCGERGENADHIGHATPAIKCGDDLVGDPPVFGRISRRICFVWRHIRLGLGAEGADKSIRIDMAARHGLAVPRRGAIFDRHSHCFCGDHFSAWMDGIVGFYRGLSRLISRNIGTRLWAFVQSPGKINTVHLGEITANQRVMTRNDPRRRFA